MRRHKNNNRQSKSINQQKFDSELYDMGQVLAYFQTHLEQAKSNEIMDFFDRQHDQTDFSEFSNVFNEFERCKFDRLVRYMCGRIDEAELIKILQCRVNNEVMFLTTAQLKSRKQKSQISTRNETAPSIGEPGSESINNQSRSQKMKLNQENSSTTNVPSKFAEKFNDHTWIDQLSNYNNFTFQKDTDENQAEVSSETNSHRSIKLDLGDPRVHSLIEAQYNFDRIQLDGELDDDLIHSDDQTESDEDQIDENDPEYWRVVIFKSVSFYSMYEYF